ncbi:sulfite exporter TauE/SafE family protein [Tenuifilum thalassicum]|uniref:Probable membrane transporter protein n=1 Tax=Tenuifilum thalassicum TaxID=2590900 RepID=A0A7D4CFY0_9BACT|nr:sulfite exporter TauE/SafE family protein [Tenuifilum thalassicum]QKG79406.1 sulfite exporter TauE/SafE family protein [Tenuifilum thalassicum]
MDFWLYPIVALVGAIAGFINTLAGSGSLLTLPVLIFLGLPANVANGTNRVGIFMQSIAAVGGFKKKKVFEWNEGIWLTIPAAIGALVGSMVAVDIDEQLMNKIIGALLVFMFILLLVKPERWLKQQTEKLNTKLTPLRFIIFLAIGFYGGFIQAGVGYFLLSGLVLGVGVDLVKANALKVLITFVFTILALGVFIYNSQVDYVLGITMGLGNMVGAWIATHVAVKKGAVFIRWFLLGCVLVFAFKLLLF